MPAIETSDLHQKAVLWTTSGFDDYGDPTIGSPVELNVRWETGQKESLDSQGNTIALDSIAVVDQAVAVGSVMWLGALADVPSPATDLRSVVGYSEIPDLKNREFRRTVSLMKLSNELPATG